MPRFFRILVGVAALAALTVPMPARGEVSCSDHRISAKAVATNGDIQAFVRCAAEYVLEHGTVEARRAFHEDERWRHGSTYVFAHEIAQSGTDSEAFVYPPDPSREGRPWGESIDGFGNDLYYEMHRMLGLVDSGWIYYSFPNPVTGREVPKTSYIVGIDWDGTPAFIGAGLHANDRPGTCRADEVNAANLSAEPTERNLQELVRCAALVVESEGYFAKPEIERDPRWGDGSTNVFVMDMLGNQLISSSQLRVNGNALHEWGGGGNRPEAFGGRDVVSIADAFGESYIYYRSFNPVTGREQSKVGMLKRVVAQGVPVLVGSAYFVPADQSQAGADCSDNFITAGAVRTRRDIQALVQCAAEYIAAHGTEEAHRSFHEDPRWDHPEFYVFVRLLERPGARTQLLVYPPDRSREGVLGTSLHEVSESLVGDYLRELHRISDTVGSGWVHYYFINRVTGTVEPKASYFIEIDWNGQRAVVAAGIYERDLPGTCRREQVNATSLEADPSESGLEEFVRCAAAQVESLGFFAGPVFGSDSRWQSGSVKVIGVNAATREVAFGGTQSDRPFEAFVAEAFGGRDVVGIVETFGEAYWYYMQPDQAAGKMVPEVAFVKRVLAQGVPLLVGTAYRRPDHVTFD